MLRGTLVRCAQEARRPMIKFPDRKSAQKGWYIKRVIQRALFAKEALIGCSLYNLVILTSVLNRSFSFSFPRTLPDTQEPQPHPSAPEEVQKNFSHFQEVLQSGPHFHPEKLQSSSASSEASSGESSSGGGGDIAEDLHDLPRRFWQTPSLLIEEKEIDAINVSLSIFYLIAAPHSSSMQTLRVVEPPYYRNERCHIKH